MTVETHPLRADAQRNLTRIVESAHEVFAEHGIDAPLLLIAERAGVGVGTIFRRFPSKDECSSRCFCTAASSWSPPSRRRDESADAGAAFVRLLETAIAAQIGDRCFCDAIGTDLLARQELVTLFDEAHTGLASLLERAQAEGAIRADVTAEDLLFVVHGVAHAGLMLEDVRSGRLAAPSGPCARRPQARGGDCAALAGPSRAASSWPRAAAPESTPARLGRSVPRNRTVRFAVLGNSVQRTAASGYPSSRSSALKRRIVMGGLIALSLVLITVSFRSSALDGVQGTAAGILRPFEVAADRVSAPFRDTISWFHGLADAKSENAKLQKQVDALQEKLVLDEGALQENVQLRKALAFLGPPSLANFDRRHASVLTNPQSALDESITIAGGTHDGIRAGDPVIDDFRRPRRHDRPCVGERRTSHPAHPGSERHGDRSHQPRGGRRDPQWRVGGALIFDRVPKAPSVQVGEHRHHRRLAG